MSVSSLPRLGLLGQRLQQVPQRGAVHVAGHRVQEEELGRGQVDQILYSTKYLCLREIYKEISNKNMFLYILC